MTHRIAILLSILVLPALLLGACAEKSEPPATGGGTGGGAAAPETPSTPPQPLAEGTYEIGCHMCVFEKEGANSCATAAMVGDEILLVEGDGVPNAHTTGLCAASKQAVLAGEIRDGVVHVTKIQVEE